MEADLASTGARERNPRGQGERLRGALIDSAIELLADLQNVDALSIRAVTARAGVTPTALYLHFADKEALIEAVKERCFAELISYCSRARAAAPDEPRAKLEAGCGAYIQFSTERPGYYRVLFHTPHVTDEPPPAPDLTALKQAQTEWPPGAVEALGQLIESVHECLPPGTDPVLPSMMIWGGLHGYIGLRRSIPDGPFPPTADYVKRLVDAHAPSVAPPD
ncbi:MAG TPA: TetR/AcrR family transcriptional regulator [Solirubrobacteraceae bacterium]